MATHISDAILHIDEPLEKWQRDILEDHMRLQDGVISTGYNDNDTHLMLIEYNPECGHPTSYLHMVERHGYHAERVG